MNFLDSRFPPATTRHSLGLSKMYAFDSQSWILLNAFKVLEEQVIYALQHVWNKFNMFVEDIILMLMGKTIWKYDPYW